MKKLSILLSTTLLCSAAFAQIDLKKGLMLHLPFNGNTMDASPMGNNATNFGAKLTTDQWGNSNSAYIFDGVANFMVVKNDTSLSPKNFTICARVDLMGFYSDFCYNNVILSKGIDREPGSYSVRTTQTIIADCNFQDTSKHNYRCDVQNISTTVANMNTTPYIKSNNWDCLIATYTDDTVKMYVNGVFRYQYYEPSFLKNSSDLYIGRVNPSDRPFWFNGKIDDIRLYNRALNMLEIDSVCSSKNPQQGTSIHQASLVQTLQLANNPVGNELQLKLESKQMGGELTILDMMGKTVLKITTLHTNNIKLDAVASGLYTINYLLDNSYYHAKMLKQ